MTAPLPLDPPRRRAALAASANPAPRHDYAISLAASFAGPDGTVLHLEVRYVPDRVIIRPDCLKPYLDRLSAGGGGKEDLALAVLDDLNNEVVPRWIEVTISADSDGTAHRVVMQDRQPQWDNPALLERISPR